MLETPIEYLKGVGDQRASLLRSELQVIFKICYTYFLLVILIELNTIKYKT